MEAQKRKTPKAFRLSDAGESLLTAIAERLGVNQTAVIEMAIRRMATSEGVTAPEPATNRATSPSTASGKGSKDDNATD